MQDEVSVSEQEHAHTKRQLSEAIGKVTERDQQMRDVFAEFNMERATDDAGLVPAKRAMTEKEAAHLQSLAEFRKEKRYDGELRHTNGGRLGFRDDVEWMRRF